MRIEIVFALKTQLRNVSLFFDRAWDVPCHAMVYHGIARDGHLNAMTCFIEY